MYFTRSKTRFVARTLSVALVWCGLQSGIAQAAFVPAQDLNSTTVTQAQDSRAALNALLARDDVRSQLMAHGVSPEVAEARIAALTDEEARLLADQFGDLPAGGSGFGVVVLVLLVLLLTDLLGVTDVFPAVRPAI